MIEEQIQILKDFYAKNNNKVSGMKLKSWFKKDHPEILIELEKILEKYPNLTLISNICNCIVENIPLDSFKCKTCGKELKIKSWTIRPEYCSTKCAMNNEELQKQKAETIAKDPDFWKKRQEKIIKTNLERYGTKTPAESQIVKQHMKNAFAKDPDIWKKRLEKSEKTCMEKYGVKNAYCIKSIKDKSIKTHKIKLFNSFLNYKHKWIPLFSLEEFLNTDIKNTPLKYHCNLCNNDFSFCFKNKKIVINSVIPQNIPICPCELNLPHGISLDENNIINFIKSIYSGEILISSKKYTYPFELDIVIPEKNVAIEYNGNYWHSLEIRPDKNYHLNKSKLCNSKNLSLLHIFEFNWYEKNKQNIIKNRIKELLEIYDNIDYNKISIIENYNDIKIHAFLTKYHLNGDCDFNNSISLIYQNKIISTICLKNNKIVRYAYSLILQNDLALLLSKCQIKNLIIELDYSFENINKFKNAGFQYINATEPIIIYKTSHKINNEIYNCGNLVFEKRY